MGHAVYNAFQEMSDVVRRVFTQQAICNCEVMAQGFCILQYVYIHDGEGKILLIANVVFCDLFNGISLTHFLDKILVFFYEFNDQVWLKLNSFIGPVQITGLIARIKV